MLSLMPQPFPKFGLIYKWLLQARATDAFRNKRVTPVELAVLFSFIAPANWQADIQPSLSW